MGTDAFAVVVVGVVVASDFDIAKVAAIVDLFRTFQAVAVAS